MILREHPRRTRDNFQAANLLKEAAAHLLRRRSELVVMMSVGYAFWKHTFSFS
jgi:hypothetical protein